MRIIEFSCRYSRPLIVILGFVVDGLKAVRGELAHGVREDPVERLEPVVACRYRLAGDLVPHALGSVGHGQVLPLHDLGEPDGRLVRELREARGGTGRREGRDTAARP